MSILTTRCIYCAFFSVLLLPALSQAQEPSSSFEELQANMRLSAGDEIQIVEGNGTTIKGQFESMSADRLNLLVDGSRREVSDSSTQEIRLQRPDSVQNGIWIGLGAGVAATVIAAKASCGNNDPECEAAVGGYAFLPFTGVGLLTEFLIDHFVHGYDTVFESPNRTQNSGVAISPIFVKEGKGVQVSFSF